MGRARSHSKIERSMTPEEVVVIKWGGGLITDKARALTPKPRVMAALARAMKTYLTEEASARRKVVSCHTMYEMPFFFSMSSRRCSNSVSRSVNDVRLLAFMYFCTPGLEAQH